MFKHYAIRLLLTLVILFVALEIGLQVASLVLPSFFLRSAGEREQAADLTILCVGDSHTFGAPLPSKDAYPAQLSKRLNSARTEQKVRVVNLGIPGQNSAMVANRLEKQINSYQPDLIIVWVGLNNSWNFDEFDLDRVDDPFIRWRQLVLRSKVLRLIVVAGFRESGGQTARAEKAVPDPARGGVHQWRLGGEVIEIPTSPSKLSAPTRNAIRAQRQSDYSRIIDMTKAYAVPLIFVTYPIPILENQWATNLAITREAKQDGILIVASSDAFMRAVGDGHTPEELVVEAVGPHPTRLLYRYLVDLLSPAVDRVLTDSRAGG